MKNPAPDVGGTTNETTSLPGRLHRFLLRMERLLDRVPRPWRGVPEAVTVVGHLGHGTTNELVVRGRVLSGRLPTEALATDHVVLRLRRMARRFLTREVGGISMELEIAGARAMATTDEEGHFEARWREPSTPFPAGRIATVEVVRMDGPAGPIETWTTSHDLAAVIDAAGSGRAIVSDLDDTILSTGVRATASMLWRTLSGSYLTREPVDGMPALLRDLAAGTSDAPNSCFYVSSSPWNLYDFLTLFLRRQGGPQGPLFLTDYGITEEFLFRPDHHHHKLGAIREVGRMHSRLSMVLLGDITEADPDIYAQMALELPGRVDAILLHDDGHDDEARERAERRMADLDVPWAIGDAAQLRARAIELGLIGTATPR